jgi:hypothetical protein
MTVICSTLFEGRIFVPGIIYITSTDDGSAQGGGCDDLMLMFHLCNRMDELDLYLCCPTRSLLLQTRISNFLNAQYEELAVGGQYMFMVCIKNKPNSLAWCHTFLHIFHMFQFVVTARDR